MVLPISSLFWAFFEDEMGKNAVCKNLWKILEESVRKWKTFLTFVTKA